MEIELNSTPTIKKLGQLKQKAQTPPLVKLEEYIRTPKWSVKDQGAHLNCSQPNSMQSLLHLEPSHLWE